jgi:hypothetical protein
MAISIVTNGYSFSLRTRRLLAKEPLRKIITVFLQSVHVETKNTFILDFTGTSAALVGLTSLHLYQLTGWQRFDGIGGMLIGVVAAFSSVVLICFSNLLFCFHFHPKDGLCREAGTNEVKMGKSITVKHRGSKDNFVYLLPFYHCNTLCFSFFTQLQNVFITNVLTICLKSFLQLQYSRIFLCFQCQFSCKKTMRLRHGCFGTVQHIINQQRTKGQGFVVAIDVYHFFFIHEV